ncbi:MAG: Hsp20/alpha crystallin family protein [Candidatus Bathyarchaeota archaeon]|nr:Hsp20/alpha crystallin family protein [Candidatus Bathyarchaeota archaeon]
MSDFDDIIDNTEKFYRKLAERMFKEIEEIDKAVKTGRIQGDWEIKPIDEPGVKGYIARGKFYSHNIPNESLPLAPKLIEEIREPLTDVFEEEDKIKVYVELPGVEKDDIQLNLIGNSVELKAKNFYKIIALPTQCLNFDHVISKYKNGVLEITIPKKEPQGTNERYSIKIE